MTQFKPELIVKILAGEKTQTRRLVKMGIEFAVFHSSNETNAVVTRRPRFEPQNYGKRLRLKWEVGRTYAISPGRGKKQVARFKLLRIRREDVRQISGADSRAEGFRNRLEFWLTWCGFHDLKAIDAINHALYHGIVPIKALNLRPEKLYQAWALTFELEKGPTS